MVITTIITMAAATTTTTTTTPRPGQATPAIGTDTRLARGRV